MRYDGVIKKSRTLDLAAAVAVLGAVQITLPGLNIDPAVSGWVNMGVAVMIAVLRYKTTSTVGDK